MPTETMTLAELEEQGGIRLPALHDMTAVARSNYGTPVKIEVVSFDEIVHDIVAMMMAEE
jgi:hypothetical protein